MMSGTTSTFALNPSALAPAAGRPAPWLRNARWDLMFISFSAVVAFLPYSVYLFFGRDSAADASTPGTAAYQARVWVNLMVGIVFGGPHMYATFTRTVMDPTFRRKKPAFIASSLLVPVFVVTMALYSYDSYIWLLSIFFALASVHALHQLVWISESYNLRAGNGMSLAARLIDYGVVFSSLYPIAIWKMAEGNFLIGPISLKYNLMLQGRHWVAYLAFAAFFVLLGAFIVKTVLEWRAGRFNAPKTLLIAITCVVMFWTPAFPNLDTAFQGVNAWHSFQYLALTWWANRIREERTGRRLGFLHVLEDMWARASAHARETEAGVFRWVRSLWRGVIGGLRRVDDATGWTTFYLLCLSMLPISGMLILTAKFFWPDVHGNQPGADECYSYMGILSVLLVHYLHDALLFTDTDSLVERKAVA
jgi:hypothetical protein